MPTQEICLRAEPDIHDLLVAELAELGFTSFASEGEELHSYRTAPSPHAANTDKRQISKVLHAYGVTARPRYSMHEDRNWNAEWEASIRSVKVGAFVIAPDWDLPPGDGPLIIRINPKMSFGTGHHESTRLALLTLQDLTILGKRVLDAGIGTGILSIAAAKLGAAEVIAFDIDESVAGNFHENVVSNGVHGRVRFVPGTLNQVPVGTFDVVLANINRSVLLDYLAEFSMRLSNGGNLILSGLLKTDRELIFEAARSHRLKPISEMAEGDWWSCNLAMETEDRV